MGQLITAELGQVGLCHGRAGARFDEGAWDLAPLFMRRRDDRGQRHIGMFVKRILHLKTGDVLTTQNDEVLGPVADLDPLVRVADGKVAGMKDTPLEGGRRRFRVLAGGVAERDGLELIPDAIGKRDLGDGIGIEKDKTFP